MTQNLKIEVLTGDISIDGMVVTNLVTKEELSTAIVKKADLGTDGKIPTSQLPAEIVNTAGIVDEVKLQLETSIKDAVDESNAYAESYTDNALSSKADLTSGKVPLEQLPSIDQYPQFGTALSNLSTSILTSVKQRTDQLEKTKADLGEDGKVLREQIPSYEKISGLPEQLEVMSTQTAAVSGELDEHKLQTADQIDTLKENIEANVQQLTNRQSHLMRTYATKELGVDAKVGVKPSEYFYVRSANEDEMLVEYQNIGGVPTPSGKAYPSSSAVQLIRYDVAELAENTAYFHRTVATMIADESLTDGKVVATKGYHNISDDGGAIYLISAVATNYSIPLANGLHAIFRDSFDIRKFGIQDNVTLDQTEYFQRMVNYADSRVYEIDFHNFKIMTPMLTQLGRGSYPFRGMIFNEAHKLKNLFIANNKTVQLQQDTSPIIFLPITNPTEETFFELQNVIFDPYVADYNITAGRYDGNMHGFIAHPHVSSEILWSRSKTNFSFLFDNVKFKSAAISYNLTTSAIYAEQNIIRGCSGDYIGLFYNHFANRLEASDVHGLYRDDQHAAGRLLVTTLLHEEPETGGAGTINPVQTYQKIKNVSSIKKGTGLPHIAYKHHSVTNHTIDLIEVDSAVGEVFIFAPITSKTTVINKLITTKCNNVMPETYVKSITISDTPAFNKTILRSTAKVDVLTMRDVTLDGALSSPALGASNVQELNLHRVLTKDVTYGFIRNATVSINTINIKDCKTLAGRAFECNWSVMNIDGFEFKDVGAFNTFFLKGASSVAIINAVNMKNTLPAGSFSYHFMADAGASLTVNVRFSDFGVRPAISNATLNFELSTPNSASITYDPPSIAANASIATTVALSGAKVGSVVQAAFDQYNANIEVDAVVSSNNTVTVKFKNTSAAAVDLPNGTLTVKLI